MFGEAPFRKCEDCYTKRCEHPQFPGNSYPYDYQFRINRDNVCDPFPRPLGAPNKAWQFGGRKCPAAWRIQRCVQHGETGRETMEGNPVRSHEMMILSVSLGGTQDYGELVMMVLSI